MEHGRPSVLYLDFSEETEQMTGLELGQQISAVEEKDFHASGIVLGENVERPFAAETPSQRSVKHPRRNDGFLTVRKLEYHLPVAQVLVFARIKLQNVRYLLYPKAQKSLGLFGADAFDVRYR